MNKKYLKEIIEGVISKLVTLNESYLDSERLCRAIDQYAKGSVEKPDREKIIKKVDAVLTSLYISREILPDVLNGNGYIIALNCEDAVASANELYERSVSVTSPMTVCLPTTLRCREDAVQELNDLDEKTKQIVENITHNYIENLVDCKDVFPEFA